MIIVRDSNTDQIGLLNDTIVVALLFGVVGMLCTGPFVYLSSDSGWWLLIPASGIAAFLTGWLFWGMFTVSSRPTPITRGVLLGGIIGFCSHPVAWYVMMLVAYFSGWESSLGAQAINPFEGLYFGVWVFSFWSWLLVGWFTVIVGCVTGGLCAWYLVTK